MKTGTRKKKEERTRYRRGGRAKSVLGQRVWRERERRVIKREDHSSLNFSFYTRFPTTTRFASLSMIPFDFSSTSLGNRQLFGGGGMDKFNLDT